MDKGSKRVTIKDIAQRCGVTANTVSRALRGDTRISEATLKKVQQMAHEMGYIRNNLAATMRSGRSNLISIIVDDIENPHYATLVHKMSAFLKENGYKVVAVTEKAEINYTQIDYTVPVALVMGAEDVGISPEVLKLTDEGASIPMFGEIGSLNVSVAAGVMMYEVVRQRLLANLEVI